MKKTFVIAIIGLFLMMLPLMAGAEIVDSGTCGDNLTWEIDNEGLLTISGFGEMNSNPWEKSIIKQVIIHQGITSIKDFAFNDCYNLSNVILPNSVNRI